LNVEAYGAVDEFTSALGLARATTKDPWVRETILALQKDLVAVMGELAVAEEDWPRYLQSKIPKVEPAMLERLDQAVADLEGKKLEFNGWAIPGATHHAAALDVARAVGRRAERRVVQLQSEGKISHELVLKILNRSSDMLWLMARLEENSSK
jgi:cob(I)alamin adenosyltransferase